MWSYNYEYGSYLQHHGIKGQKWGVRRYQNENGSLTAEGKKRYRLSAQDVKDGKAEADERIKYYGGKNAARNAIVQESKEQYKGVGNQHAAMTALSMLGPGLGAVTLAAGAPVAVPALLISSGIVGAGAATVWAGKAASAITKHKNEQLTYTQDSDAGADYVVTNRKDK